MGLGSWVDGIGDGLEHLASDGEHAVGSFVEVNTQGVADGLDAVGWHGGAKDVRSWGNSAADHLGAQVPEMELGQSSDPKDLVHGDASKMEQTAEHLQKFATAFEEAGSALKQMDSWHWKGSAGDAFRSKFATHYQQWLTAADACTEAATALKGFAATISWAQGQAKEAIAVYDKGQAASAAATQTYNKAVSTYNTAVAAGHNPGPKPTEPTGAGDPGTPLRKQAIAQLQEARHQRDTHGRQAAAALDKATALAPKEPSFLTRMASDELDLSTDYGLENAHFFGGVIKGAAGLVNFARGLNPWDPYNITHPAQYVTQVDSTAASLLHAANNPTVLVKSVVGSGWGSDPSEAGGRFVVNLASGALTDGGSEGAAVAADAAKSAAENTAVDASQAAAFNSATSGASGLMGDAMKSLDAATPHLDTPDLGKASDPSLPTPKDQGAQALAEISQGAVSFPEDSAAIQYGRDHWNAHADALPASEKDALYGYTREFGSPDVPTYKEINGYLRKGEGGTPQVLQAINEIDNALKRCPISEDVVVTRGTDLDHLDLGHPTELTTDGMVVTEQSFTSTSLGEPADSFAGKQAVLHLVAPAGTPAMWVENISAFAVEERELLLGRGVQWQAQRVMWLPTKLKSGQIIWQWHIYGKILPGS
jgi:tetratricopeptide (TPR) repeat protein